MTGNHRRDGLLVLMLLGIELCALYRVQFIFNRAVLYRYHRRIEPPRFSFATLTPVMKKALGNILFLNSIGVQRTWYDFSILEDDR